MGRLWVHEIRAREWMINVQFADLAKQGDERSKRYIKANHVASKDDENPTEAEVHGVVRWREETPKK